MRTTRKVLSLLLAICTVLTCFSHIPVTVRATDFDSITVDIPNYVIYNGKSHPYPYVYDGDTRLKQGLDYSVYFENTNKLTDSAMVTITGHGKYAGFEKTYTYAILKRDMSHCSLSIPKTPYQAGPVLPEVTINDWTSDTFNTKTVDYTTVIEQNINVGNPFVRAVCTGFCYGAPTGIMHIYLDSAELQLPGYYMGQADGTLDVENTVVSEAFLTPGEFTGCVDATGLNIAYYELYKVDGQNTALVATYESEVGNSTRTAFEYDFSPVYESQSELGFETYILSYMWMDEASRMYSGNLIMYIVTKVPPATTIQMNVVENDGYFRQEYLSVSSEDGALEKSVWSVSDSSVATVDRGAVTFLKPGTVTVTAKCGNLSAKQTLTAEAIDMEDTTILDWKDGKAALMYDYILLKDGIDYTATATTKNGITTVTATGKGLFQGTVTQHFDAKTGRPTDPPVSGDLDRDSSVNNNDVVVLLWHTLFPEEYPLTVDGDLTKDGSTNNNDVVLLLWHTLFPDEYPLN